MPAPVWHCAGHTLQAGPLPLLMGIVNVTPDSFSDGGAHNTVDAAVQHALELAEDGADIIDIGGESTRPGADPVDVDEELRRTIPVKMPTEDRQDQIPTFLLCQATNQTNH